MACWRNSKESGITRTGSGGMTGHEDRESQRSDYNKHYGVDCE